MKTAVLRSLDAAGGPSRRRTGGGPGGPGRWTRLVRVKGEEVGEIDRAIEKID